MKVSCVNATAHYSRLYYYKQYSGLLVFFIKNNHNYIQIEIFRKNSEKHTQCCPLVQVLPVYLTDDILLRIKQECIYQKTDDHMSILYFIKYVPYLG